MFNQLCPWRGLIISPYKTNILQVQNKMEVKFGKRKKPTTRKREELEETSVQEVKPNTPTVPVMPEEDNPVNFQPKRKMAPSAPPSAPAPLGAYYQSSYSQRDLAELRRNQLSLHQNFPSAPPLETPVEAIQEPESESEKKSSVSNVLPVIDEELDESDKEKAKEARELRMHIRKRSEAGPDTLPDPNRPDLEPDDVERAALYKVLYIDKKPVSVEPGEEEQEEEEQIQEWEKEIMSRGLGKKQVEDKSVARFAADKMSVKSQLGRLLREIKMKCGIMSVESIQNNMQKHIQELESALELNRKRMEEVTTGAMECRKKVERGEMDKKLAVDREQYYSDLLAYVTDLEDLFSNFGFNYTNRRKSSFNK
eukprot:TRINITY_DN105064_c0_g1_i1.p1 TRINITY_DN105064_c0_g1~~TRINITY_DN105064_c0_g1_i1.p1  ORF type:complete len:367 (+),score=48.16 TRINITY_DN105064_c0_g1_i1:2164-3264(+)